MRDDEEMYSTWYEREELCELRFAHDARNRRFGSELISRERNQALERNNSA
jgi:hypothetical protein